MAIMLNKKDLQELLKLTNEAQNTPVVCMSVAQGLRGEDWASQVWERVREKWHELGKKYGFDPTTIKGVDTETGEVKRIT